LQWFESVSVSTQMPLQLVRIFWFGPTGEQKHFPVPSHCWPVGHVPQLTEPPQPSGALPHCWPDGQVVVGVQVATHWLPEGWKPDWQVKPHCPLLQTTLAAWAGVGQTVPQSPQLRGSLFVLTHRLLHSVAAKSSQTHFPLWHRVPVGHTAPQSPQLWSSCCRSTQTCDPPGAGQQVVPLVHPTQLLFVLQVWHWVAWQVLGQGSVPPQPSGAVPHCWPAGHVVLGVQHAPFAITVPLGQGAQRSAAPLPPPMQTKPAQQVWLPSHG
jgi:hypothetical protein